MIDLGLRMLKFGFVMLLGGLLYGCAVDYDRSLNQCRLSDRELLSRVDLKQVTDSLVVGVCPPFDRQRTVFNYQPDDPILVTDVVNIQTLNTGTLGLALGEVLKSSVHDVCRVPIRQVENGRDFRLNVSGFVGLTRDVEKIRESQFTAPDAIVTTYSYQPQKLTLVSKRIVLDDSAIVAVSTKTVIWSCDQDPLGGGGNFRWGLR
jgi:hypothetical protein